MDIKLCSKCGHNKKLDDFKIVKDTSCRSGWYYRGMCRECEEIQRKEYKANFSPERKADHLERKRKLSKKARLLNPTRQMLQGAKQRAKLKSFDFNLELNDIIIPEVCPVLGIKLIASNQTKSDNSPSLDRIDNSKGYVKGNVKVISWRANHIKTDATLSELEKVVAYVKTNLV